jgi:hypothetical protein
VTAAHRAGIAARSVAAIAGGYVLAALTATACAAALPSPRVEAVLAGMLASFLVHAGAAIWAFTARTAWRSWAGLLLAATLPATVLLVTR